MNLDEKDAGQAFMGPATGDPVARIPSRYDTANHPLEAQQMAAADLKAGKIKKEMYDSVIAASSKTLNKKKVKESFDRLSGRNALPESRLRVREVYDTSPPVNIAHQHFTQDGGFSMAVECAGAEFTVKIDASGKTFIQAEDVGEIPLPAQKAAARKARLVWHAENSKPQWGLKGSFRLEAASDRKKLIRAIWRAAPKDYRTTRGSKYHPGVMMMGKKGQAQLVPLDTMSDDELQAFAKKRRVI